MHKSRLTAIGLAIAAFPAFATGGYAAAGGAGSESLSAPATRVATSTTSDFQVVITAEKRGSGGAPAAVVKVTTSRRVDGRWHRTSVHRLKETYFWKTVTGPRAVCRLDLRTAGMQASFRPSVTVQLLVTPSIGCGEPHRYELAPSSR